jgi:hypothetical protein
MSEYLRRDEYRRRMEQLKEDGVVTVAKALAPQMGSDPKHLSKQEIDQRKFAVLNEMTQAAMGHFAYRAEVDKVRYFDKMLNWELNTTPSIGGLARRQVIQTVAAAAGVGKGVMDVAERPNVLARNITRRNWKEDATREGKVVVE